MMRASAGVMVGEGEEPCVGKVPEPSSVDTGNIICVSSVSSPQFSSFLIVYFF